MTIQILLGEEIRSEVLKILSGECLFERKPDFPHVYILSPWISDVTIEFSDLYILKEKDKIVKAKGRVDSFLFYDYNIKSINLPYALLLLKLHGGCDAKYPCKIDIVTLPPNEKNYSADYLPKVETLLDFLDENGCNVFVNPKLHSKLLLANDLALLGSFNLSKSALYDREEIGVSINDLDNLDRLEHYCWNVIRESQLYGYSSLLEWGWVRDRLKGLPSEVVREKEFSSKDRITRGWLLDQMITDVYRNSFGEFLDITGGYDRFIKSYARNLDLFYLMSLRRIISTSERKERAIGFFGYEGDESIDSIMGFVNNKFARKTVPNIRLRINSLE